MGATDATEQRSITPPPGYNNPATRRAQQLLLSQSGGARDSWRPGARDCVLVAAAEDPELISDDCYLKQAL